MKLKVDTLTAKLALLAFVGEVLLGIGCTWIILHHYYSLTTGATILSSAGVLLTLVMACAGLHFLISGSTVIFRGVACIVWIGLTLLEAALAVTIWMGTQHGKTTAQARAAITTKQDQLKKTRDKEVRQQIQADIAELRRESAAEVFGEDQEELRWLYQTGVHSLPFPCGFAGMVLLILAGVIQSKEEDEAKAAAQTARGVQYSAAPHDPPPSRKAGFQPLPVYAKDKEVDDPKERGH